MAKAATLGIELAPIDRLEEKVKRLVSLVEQMKEAQAHAASENQRLTLEVETLREHMSASETLNGELVTLREEREIIRSRVGEMLDQLETLNL